MIEDEARNACDNKSQKIGGGCYQANSHPKFQAKKKKMQKWKQFVMQEVVQKLYDTKKTHEKAIEAQKYRFQMELKKVKEKLYQVESHSIRLEYKINTLKNQKQTPKLHLT